MFYRSKKLPAIFIILDLLFIAGLVFTPCNSPSESVDERPFSSDLPILDMVLRVITNKKGSITHIEIDLKMSAVERSKENPFTLKAPVKYTVISGIADRLENLRVDRVSMVINGCPSQDRTPAMVLKNKDLIIYI